MSETDTATATATTGEADPIKNLKAEMHRKLDNVSSELAEQRKLNEQLLARMTPPAPAKTAEPDLSELIYSDPAKYARIVQERAEERIMGRLDAQQRQANVIGQLVQQYPETADKDHPLTKRAVEIYNGLPDDEKRSPAAYRAAVAEAAQDLGIKPASKRTADDEPSMGSVPRSQAARRQAKATLDRGTEDFARIMGLDVDDPKVRERLITRAGRNWNKYQGVKS